MAGRRCMRSTRSRGLGAPFFHAPSALAPTGLRPASPSHPPPAKARRSSSTLTVWWLFPVPSSTPRWTASPWPGGAASRSQLVRAGAGGGSGIAMRSWPGARAGFGRPARTTAPPAPVPPPSASVPQARSCALARCTLTAACAATWLCRGAWTYRCTSVAVPPSPAASLAATRAGEWHRGEFRWAGGCLADVAVSGGFSPGLQD